MLGFMTATNSLPRFLEFFAGGGLAHLGLDGLAQCVFANDFDPLKAKVYQDNFVDTPFSQADVWSLKSSDLPEAELAWASFPCQDLSLAGARKGLNAPRSGAFWGFWRLIEQMDANDRAPQTLALENVPGLISSRNGRDFSNLIETLAGVGYRVGALVIDAAMFTPQSRPRLFIVAHRGKIPAHLEGGPNPIFHPAALQKTVSQLEPQARLAWTWWALPSPPARNHELKDILDRSPENAVWRSEDDLQRLLGLMTPAHRDRVSNALKTASWTAGTVYRRIRVEKGAKVQRAEIRYDGLAGCLRTPGGGSSRQFLIVTEKGKIRLRPLLAREAARLMGAPNDYKLPHRETPALKVLGDAVCAPVVRWLGTQLICPLLNQRRAELVNQARAYEELPC